MCPVSYYTMVRSKNIKHDYRLKLVLHARTRGIKDAARVFGCSVNTVRKWLRRFNALGLDGLKELSRAPRRCPHRLPAEAEKAILRCRKRTPGFGAQHLKDEFDLPWGANSIARVIRQNGLTRKRKRKHRVKRDLRAIKAAYKPFTRFQMDTKYLNDIPAYWPRMTTLGLPRFQYTVRELSTGAQFLAYGSEISMTYAELTAKRLLQHLQRHGVDLRQVKIQTDNGGEFDGRSTRIRDKGFTHTVEQLFPATHKHIPSGCKNAQADVETVHNLIETEFFDIESFGNRRDFFAKATTYQHYFNLARKNASRGKKSPLDLMIEKVPEMDPRILLLTPLDLDDLLEGQGDHDVPSLVADWLSEAFRGNARVHRDPSEVFTRIQDI